VARQKIGRSFQGGSTARPIGGGGETPRTPVNNRNEVSPGSLLRRIVHSPQQNVVRMVSGRISGNLRGLLLGRFCDELALLILKGAIKPVRARPVTIFELRLKIRQHTCDVMSIQPSALEQPLVRAPGGEPAPLTSPSGPFPWLGLGFRILIVLLVGALILVVAREWNRWVGSAIEQTTDDAYLQADLTPLAAKVSGYVRRVPVDDFQGIKAGDLLVEIVDDDYRAQLNQAQANVAAAQAATDIIAQQKLLQESLVEQAEATIQASAADLTRYQLEAERQQALLVKGLAGTRQITEQAIDNQKHAAVTSV
jgi:hypothetical protein